MPGLRQDLILSCRWLNILLYLWLAQPQKIQWTLYADHFTSPIATVRRRRPQLELNPFDLSDFGSEITNTYSNLAQINVGHGKRKLNITLTDNGELLGYLSVRESDTNSSRGGQMQLKNVSCCGLSVRNLGED